MGDVRFRANRRRSLILIVALALALSFVLPRPAFAKSFAVGPVSIDATVATDGTVRVVEERTYRFKGTFGGITWDVPRGSFEGRQIDTSLVSVGVLADGRLETFARASEGTSGTYELTEQTDCLSLRLYRPSKDEVVVFQAVYEMPGLASRWADVAELYWQYVPADEGSGGAWSDVTALVHLPVPPEEQVSPGESVQAWGHGPLDGEVSFEGNDVRYTSPGVGTGEFLEMRIAFPASWLKDVPASEEHRLDTIQAEEEQWSRDANAARMKARLSVYGIPGFLCLAGLGSFVAAFIDKHRKRMPVQKASFADTYFRDIPSGDHPAVLGMLYRHGYTWRDDFTATIMHLTDLGAIDFDVVEQAEVRHRKLRDDAETIKRVYRLTPGHAGTARMDDQKPNARKIDRAAWDFLFQTVASNAPQDDAVRARPDEPYVLVSSFEAAADRDPKAYEDGYTKWEAAVHAAFQSRGFVKSKHTEGGIYPGILGLIDFALFVLLGLVGWLLDVPNLYLLPAMVLCFAAGIYCVWNTEETQVTTFSPEGLELQAKLEALKRWLTDFTRLEEAVPTDVVLWNHLLVMAAVFGVADKVVSQLRVALPQLLEDDAFVSYAWYRRMDDEQEPFADRLREGVSDGNGIVSERLHPVSSSQRASSRDSSSRGSGGGFSGGGGGGFSGGSRGGAF